MVLIDTNVIYLLSELEGNDLINTSKLFSFVRTKEVCISPITIFEILNNKEFQSKYSFIIHKTIERCKSVVFLSTSFYSQYFDSDFLIDLENKSPLLQIEAKRKVGTLVVELYSYFFANLITSVIIAYFLIFPFLEEHSLDCYDDCKGEFQKSYNMLFDKEYEILKRYFTGLISQGFFSEKERNIIINHFTKKTCYFFVSTIKDAVTSLNKGNFSYGKLFNKLKAKIRSVNLEKDVEQSKIEHFNDFTFFNYVLGNKQSTKKMSTYIVDKIVDLLTNDGSLFNPATDKLYKEYLKQFLLTGRKNKSNDLLDTSLVDVLQIIENNSNINEIITFDKRFCELLKRADLPNLKIYSYDDFV